MKIKDKIPNVVMNKKLWQITLVFFGVLVFSICTSLFVYIFSNNQHEKPIDYTNNNMRIFGLNIPKNLNFAGERVPQNDFSIKESLDREFLINTYWHSNALLLFKRANRWFPVMEPILKRNNVPDDFKYIALIESHLTNAVSPQGATGFWQFIEPTAVNYGLEINDEVDERYHVEKSTEAACKYFKDGYAKFGNWTLVAASYNLGMGGIENKLTDQKVKSYYDLSLNEETGRYVYRILAIKTLMQHPELFGFELKKKDLYHRIPTINVKVDSSITNLADFALNKGYNLKVLKLFNPWLRNESLKNTAKKTYVIQFPKKEYLERAFDEIESDSLKNVLHLEKQLEKNQKDSTSGKHKASPPPAI